MIEYLSANQQSDVVPITPLHESEVSDWLDEQSEAVGMWVKRCGFTGTAGSTCLVPGEEGRLARVLVGMPENADLWAYSGLAEELPTGSYSVDASLDHRQATQAALGWALGSYAFTKYKKRQREPGTLMWPPNADHAAVERSASATFLVRDLINTPAADMGPTELAAAVQQLATTHNGSCEVIVGTDLLKQNYPAIYAVGRGSERTPVLCDLKWGDSDAPRVTLVGKGVCFDSGGLDLKAATGMKIMKKDMGGAAQVLGLAKLIMAGELHVRLRVLIPAVENLVACDAIHPLDVIPTRKGLTVEVGNTDLEGRLILCDALAEADGENPDLIVDFGTLTGAANEALGPDLPAMYCTDDALADDLIRHATTESDPMWRLPVWQPYRTQLDSAIADINNMPAGSGAGSIACRLFLGEFVRANTPWIHLDHGAWNYVSRPGRPEGGEAKGIHALYALIDERFNDEKQHPSRVSA